RSRPSRPDVSPLRAPLPIWDRDRVVADRLEVRLLVVRQHPQRRAHLHRAYWGAGADELGELDERTLGLPDLAFVSLEHDVVAARDDADIELVFQRPEMVVVAPEEGDRKSVV